MSVSMLSHAGEAVAEEEVCQESYNIDICPNIGIEAHIKLNHQ